MRMMICLRVLVLATFLTPWWGAVVAAGSPPAQIEEGSLSEQEASSFQQELIRGFDWRFKAVGFLLLREPEDSPLNPNNIFEISRYRTELDLRPDLGLKYKRLELGVKPRLASRWDQWEDGIRDGDSRGEAVPYVNEWISRYMLHEDLFVSYGRENLQWGPSNLISPSNPFILNNGKNNPEIEVPGLDYARAVWIPSVNWNVSFIANTEEGEADFIRPFRRGYALKVDYTGEKKYFSIIPAYRESEDFQLGYYGGWSVTDALLLYGEGAFRDNGDASILIGESYTLSFGPTISLEYYHNGSGCARPIQQCFLPFGTHSFDEVLVRENYVLAQFVDTRIMNVFNVIVRWIHDIDDTSNISVGILEYELGKHTKLFAVGHYLYGQDDTEFGSLLKYSAMLGAEYNF